jgi:hypothetical protein
MKENSKFLSGFEPTAVRGKWFEVNDLNHSATGAHMYTRLDDYSDE